jgi:hypothetical protein
MWMRRALVVVAAVLGVVPGCSVRDAQTAAEARTSLIGMDQERLSLCAGLPTKVERVDERTELRSYEWKPSDSNSVSLNVPIIGGGFSLGSGGECKVTFRLVDGVVDAMGYAGDTDAGPGGRDALCAPIVRHCVGALRAGG